MPAVTVGATSTTIVAAIFDRSAVLIKNTHNSSNLHLAFGETATTDHFYLSPGESYVESPERLYKGAINGISSSGDITVKYTQRLE